MWEETGWLPLSYIHRFPLARPSSHCFLQNKLKCIFPEENWVDVWDLLKNRTFSSTMNTKESEMQFSSYACSRFLSCDVYKIALLSKSKGFLNCYSKSLGSNHVPPDCLFLDFRTTHIMYCTIILALQRLIFSRTQGAYLWNRLATTRWQKRFVVTWSNFKDWCLYIYCVYYIYSVVELFLYMDHFTPGLFY